MALPSLKLHPTSMSRQDSRKALSPFQPSLALQRVGAELHPPTLAQTHGLTGYSRRRCPCRAL